MPFLNKDALLVRTSDGKNVVLAEELLYQSPSTGTITKIPIGAKSDGGSEPRIIAPLGLTGYGTEWYSYILHDYYYRRTWLPKEFCDSMLLEAMRSQGVPETKCMEIYLGVKLGAGKAFDEDRAALEKDGNI